MVQAVANRIDVFILTGFLGSGKTTLLNGLLRNPELKDTAVVVNEFGDVGLDHLLVEGASGDIILLDSGCLCCASDNTLEDTLIDLWVRRERGDIPRFSRLVIETSGLADPLPLVAITMKNNLVCTRYRMAGIIAVIDTVFGVQNLEQHHEARQQLALANTVILTKSDRVNSHPDETRRDVISRNPNATIVEVSLGRINPETLLEAGDIDLRHNEPLPRSSHYPGAPRFQYTFRSDRPLQWANIADFASSLASEGLPLLRAKGLLSVAYEQGPVLFQAVRNIIETSRLKEWPGDDHTTQIVFIFDSPQPEFDKVVALLTQ